MKTEATPTTIIHEGNKSALDNYIYSPSRNNSKEGRPSHLSNLVDAMTNTGLGVVEKARKSFSVITGSNKQTDYLNFNGQLNTKDEFEHNDGFNNDSTAGNPIIDSANSYTLPDGFQYCYEFTLALVKPLYREYLLRYLDQANKNRQEIYDAAKKLEAQFNDLLIQRALDIDRLIYGEDRPYSSIALFAVNVVRYLAEISILKFTIDDFPAISKIQSVTDDAKLHVGSALDRDRERIKEIRSRHLETVQGFYQIFKELCQENLSIDQINNQAKFYDCCLKRFNVLSSLEPVPPNHSEALKENVRLLHANEAVTNVLSCNGLVSKRLTELNQQELPGNLKPSDAFKLAVEKKLLTKINDEDNLNKVLSADDPGAVIQEFFRTIDRGKGNIIIALSREKNNNNAYEKAARKFSVFTDCLAPELVDVLLGPVAPLATDLNDPQSLDSLIARYRDRAFKKYQLPLTISPKLLAEMLLQKTHAGEISAGLLAAKLYFLALVQQLKPHERINTKLHALFCDTKVFLESHCPEQTKMRYFLKDKIRFKPFPTNFHSLLGKHFGVISRWMALSPAKGRQQAMLAHADRDRYAIGRKEFIKIFIKELAKNAEYKENLRQGPTHNVKFIISQYLTKTDRENYKDKQPSFMGYVLCAKLFYYDWAYKQSELAAQADNSAEFNFNEFVTAYIAINADLDSRETETLKGYAEQLFTKQGYHIESFEALMGFKRSSIQFFGRTSGTLFAKALYLKTPKHIVQDDAQSPNDNASVSSVSEDSAASLRSSVS